MLKFSSFHNTSIIDLPMVLLARKNQLLTQIWSVDFVKNVAKNAKKGPIDANR